MKAQENERSSTEHLIDGYPEENFDKPLQHREIVGKHSRSYSTVVLILLLLYFSTVETSNLALRVRSTKQQKNEYFVPQSALRYQQRPEWSELRYPWNLPPSDALDSVWEDLLSGSTSVFHHTAAFADDNELGQNVKVTEEELISSTPNVTNPIQTVDGGYVGVIGVYHHLHCLDIIRRVTHWDHYGPRASSYELKEGILTVEHAGKHRSIAYPSLTHEQGPNIKQTIASIASAKR